MWMKGIFMQNIFYITLTLILTFMVYSFADTYTKVDLTTIQITPSKRNKSVLESQKDVDNLMRRFLDCENARAFYESCQAEVKSQVTDLQNQISTVGINWTGVNWSNMQAVKTGINWTQFNNF